MCWCLFFFFQAEDGIRDLTVTGVQTCALPIFSAEFDPTMTWVEFEVAGAGSGLGREVQDKKVRSEEHTSELQSQSNLVCRLLLEKKKKYKWQKHTHA